MGEIKNVSSMTNYNVESQVCLPDSFVYSNSMNRRDQSKLSKEQLINMLLNPAASYNAESHESLPVESKAVISAKFNPKSLTELSANKLEQGKRLYYNVRQKANFNTKILLI